MRAAFPRMGILLPLICVSLVLSTGCRPKKKPVPEPTAIDFGAELPPGQLALKKITPAEYPDFRATMGNGQDIIRSIDNSLQYLQTPSSRAHYPYLDITHDRAVASLRALREVYRAKSATAEGQDFNAEIQRDFEVYKSIGAPNPANTGYTEQVLFTGYFTPIYAASKTRTGEFQFPLYKRPADLVSDALTGTVAGRRESDGTLAPYYTRAEIEQGNLLAGQELVWLRSRWDAYVITIQGSAKLRLTDGTIYEIGYAGHNGYDYVSPGRQMLADGVITKDQLTLRGLRDYFSANPAAMDRYLNLNPRYVFFTERPGGPFGSLNVPVTPFATIATDKSVYPRAMPAFLVTPVPTNASGGTGMYRGFMMDQDTGGAIRAAGRCDIYMGTGAEAEQLAGHQLHAGALYYVALKPELVQKYLSPQKLP